MGRVTRAAARADPVLADETSAVADAAILSTEDPANVSLPASPEKASDRPPLGEIRINDQGVPVSAATSNSGSGSSDIIEVEVGSNERSDSAEAMTTSGSEDENEVVLVVGQDKKKSNTVATTAKKDVKKHGTMKKTIKSTKRTGKSNGASPEAVEQMRQTLKKNVPALKKSGKATTRKVPKDGGQEETDQVSSSSQSSSSSGTEAIVKDVPGMLRTMRQLITDQIDFPAGGIAAGKPLSCEEAVGKQGPPKSTETPVDRDLPSPRKSVKFSHDQAQDEPKAAHRLAMLFQQQLPLPEMSDNHSPLASIISRDTAILATTGNDPIEAMDALEDDIEAVENSIAVTEQPVSSRKVAPSGKSEVKNTHNEKLRLASHAKASHPSGSPKRTIRQTISPTDVALARKQNRTVKSLNTPVKTSKSTKPATTSNFQLSSEATTAKLKAQREERQKRREEEEKKQRELKTKTLIKPAKPAEVRSTATSRTRISLAAEKNREESASKKPETKTLKRSSFVASTLPPAFTRRQSSQTMKPKPAARTQPPTNTASKANETQTKASKTTIANAPRLSTMARSSRPSHLASGQTVAKKPLSQGHGGRLRILPAEAFCLKPTPAASPAESKRSNPSDREIAQEEDTKANEEPSETMTQGIQTTQMDPAKKAWMEAAEQGRAACKAWEENQMKKLAENSALKSTLNSDEEKSLQEEEDKENEEPIEQNLQEEQTNKAKPVMAMDILRNSETTHDAAYIVAEMQRIDKVRRSVGTQDNDIST